MGDTLAEPHITQKHLAGHAGTLELLSASPGRSTRQPVLCIHAAGHSARCWERWLGTFAAHGHPASALSLRGHGASTGGYRRARRRDYLDDIAVALEHSGPDTILIGHSAGAMLVEHTARQIASPPAAVLLAAMPIGGMPLSFFARQALTEPRLSIRSCLSRDAAPFTTDPAYARDLLFSPLLGDDEPGRYLQELTGDSLGYSLIDLRAPSPGPLGCPTLVIGGSLDTTFTPSQQLAKARFLGADFACLTDSKHAVMWDNRWRQAAQLAIGWVQEQAR
jgi:pimeloyl-ACP methyl ester carboxylesterase